VLIINWLKEWQFWTATITIISGIFALFKYLDGKKTIQRQQNFENYHKLIERVFRPLNGDKNTMVQIQKAAIFELRNYKDYKELTIELLKEWKDKGIYNEQIDDTLKHLKK